MEEPDADGWVWNEGRQLFQRYEIRDGQQVLISRKEKPLSQPRTDGFGYNHGLHHYSQPSNEDVAAGYSLFPGPNSAAFANQNFAPYGFPNPSASSFYQGQPVSHYDGDGSLNAWNAPMTMQQQQNVQHPNMQQQNMQYQNMHHQSMHQHSVNVPTSGQGSDKKLSRQMRGYNAAKKYHWSYHPDAYVQNLPPQSAEPQSQPQQGIGHRAGTPRPATSSNYHDRSPPYGRGELSTIKEGVTFISGAQRSVRENKLDKSYQLRLPEFFHFGRVFSMLFTENYTEKTNKKNVKHANVSDIQLGEKAYSHIRRFVVVESRRGFCYGFPIASYGNRGCEKPGVESRQHAIVYTSDHPPLPSEREGHMLESVRIHTGRLDQWLGDKSRLNCGMRIAVQYNVKVKNCGMVEESHLPRLFSYASMEQTDDWPADASDAYSAQSTQPYIPGTLWSRDAYNHQAPKKQLAITYASQVPQPEAGSSGQSGISTTKRDSLTEDSYDEGERSFATSGNRPHKSYRTDLPGNSNSWDPIVTSHEFPRRDSGYADFGGATRESGSKRSKDDPQKPERDSYQGSSREKVYHDYLPEVETHASSGGDREYSEYDEDYGNDKYSREDSQRTLPIRPGPSSSSRGRSTDEKPKYSGRSKDPRRK